MAKTDTDKRKLHADRLAAALRDNLKRRKAQERARNQGTRDQESGIGNQVSGRPVPKKPNS
jgi:hypothetical protein